MAIIYLNDQFLNRDAHFQPTRYGYMALDSTSKYPGVIETKFMDNPPFITPPSIKGLIDGKDEFLPTNNHTIYDRYSKVDKGQVTYYIDTDFINPFTPLQLDWDALSMKHTNMDRTIDYTRIPNVSIQRANSLVPTNQWTVDTQNQREDIQGLQLRTMVRNNFTPSELF